MRAGGRAVAASGLAPARLERLKTAVAEATMNAMEHGNGFDAGAAVGSPWPSDAALRVRITDHGGGRGDLRAAPRARPGRQAGRQQTPRGWGLFLIRNMVDELQRGDDDTHTLELVLHLDGGGERWQPRLRHRRGTPMPARDRPGRRHRRRRPRRARRGLRRGGGRRRRCCSTSRDVGYINSTGIALIVGVLGRARADGVAVERLRPVRPLPRDLRDHAPVGLHVHPRGRGRRPPAPKGGAR